MKRKLTTAGLILIFLLGLSVLLYPTVSDYRNSKTQSKAYARYETALSKLKKADYTALFEDADDYNRQLRTVNDPFVNAERVPGYGDCLDVAGNGIIGSVRIEKIGVEMPVYHGTSGDVLNVAAGHLQGSSLPVGGSGTHAVISAHRGLPGARLFTDLNKLEQGDFFTVTVLNRVMTYQVDQIKVVKPDQIDDLQVVSGRDYCTLITCTPYGINTHRLLVRGVRTETAGSNALTYLPADAYLVDPLSVVPVVAFILLLIAGVLRWIKYRKKA